MSKQEDTSVAACVFLENKTKILLIKRRDVPVWVLPGGGIDPGETPEIAAVREVKEETGFDTKIVKKIGEYTPINRLGRFTHLFECEIISGSAQISDETKDVKIFPLNDLPKNKMPPPYEDWINDGKKNSQQIIKKKLTTLTYKRLFFTLLSHPILIVRFLLARIGFGINSK